MDLFDGLDGLGGAANKKKLSLAEQLEAKKASTRNAFDGVDLLAAPSKPATTPAVPSTEDDDLFGIFTSAPPPSAKPNVTSQPSQSQSQSQSRPVPTGSSSSFYTPDWPVKSQQPVQSQPAQNRPVQSQSSQSQPARTSQPQSRRPAGSASSNLDRKLAQLVDMGFEPEDANRALDAMNGDVRGSVNYLMAEAQGLPLPTPKPKAPADFSEFQVAASQFGASMFSKASSLFSKGKKELEKAYNQYQGTDDGQPAWLREKPKYDARKARFAASEAKPELPRRRVPEEKDVREIASEPEAVKPAQRQRERPSRAELFRQQQQARKGASPSTSASAASASSSAIPQTSNEDLLSGVSAAEPSRTPSRTPSPAQRATERSVDKSEAPTEEIDLLNLGSNGVTLSATQSDLYTTSKEMGSLAFRRGNYEEAAGHYSSALQIVSDPSLLRALLLSNRSLAFIKAGNLRGAFDDTKEGISLIPNRGIGQEVEGVAMNDIWVKLVTRNAQSAENMEKFSDALAAWQLLLDNGHASPTILESKRRCLKALDPETEKAASKPQAPKSNRRGWGTTGAVPTSAAGKAALEKVKSSHEKQLNEEKQRDLLRDKVTARVDAWKNGNETNLRALLSTLHTVLWDSCNWQPVPLSELVVPKKVRVVYMKAVARTHPDKVPSSSSVEVKMIAQNVFMGIQHAWESFRVENNM